MQALRIIEEPANGSVTIQLPPELGRQGRVEIIVLPFEGEDTSRRTAFDPEQFFGVYKDRDVDVDAVAKDLRDEWNRNI